MHKTSIIVKGGKGDGRKHTSCTSREISGGMQMDMYRMNHMENSFPCCICPLPSEGEWNEKREREREKEGEKEKKTERRRWWKLEGMVITEMDEYLHYRYITMIIMVTSWLRPSFSLSPSLSPLSYTFYFHFHFSLLFSFSFCCNFLSLLSSWMILTCCMHENVKVKKKKRVKTCSQ